MVFDALTRVPALEAEAGDRMVDGHPVIDRETAPHGFGFWIGDVGDLVVHAGAKGDHIDVVAAADGLAPVGRGEILARHQQADGVPVGADLVAASFVASGKAPAGSRHAPRTVQRDEEARAGWLGAIIAKAERGRRGALLELGQHGLDLGRQTVAVEAAHAGRRADQCDGASSFSQVLCMMQ